MKPDLYLTVFALLISPKLSNPILNLWAQERVEVQGNLVLGKTYQRTLAPGDTLVWSLISKKGQYLGVKIEQKGIDVVVGIYSPDGAQKIEFDSPTGNTGTEKATWITNMAGNWKIEIVPLDTTQSGAYEIKWEIARQASFNDQQIIKADSLSRLGDSFYYQGQFEEAAKFYSATLNLFETAIGRTHPEAATSCNNLAAVYEELGKFAEAESLYLRAIDIREKAFGKNHLDLAESLNNLAGLYDSQNRYREAEEIYQRAVLISQNTLGADHPNVAIILNNFAMLYKNESKYDRAEQLYLRSLDINKRAFGPNHPEVATGMNNLAALYLILDRYAEAEQLFRDALRIMESSFGPVHIYVAKYLNNLASIYYNQAQYAMAEPIFKRSLEVLKQTAGEDHPEMANTLANLALLYHDQGKYTEAERLLKRSIDILVGALGLNHTDVASNLMNLASVYWIQGRYTEAKSLYLRALAIAENVLGTNHPFVAKIQNNLATVLQDLDQTTKADSLYKLAFENYEKAFGTNHKEVANILLNWGTLYRDHGDYEKAEKLLKQSVEIYQLTLGSDHPAVANTLNSLARCLFLEGGTKLQAASILNDQAIKKWQAIAGYPNLRALSYSLRAQLRKQQNDLNGALSDLEEALRTATELRLEIGGGAEGRAGYLEKSLDNFNRMVAWQIEAGHIEKALEYAESCRARVLLDQLAASRVELRGSIPDSIRDPLENRETDAKAHIAEYQQRITLLRTRKDLTAEEINKQIAELERKLRTAYDDYQQAFEEIKSASPLWRELITSGGKPVSLNTIQSQLVMPRSLMLIYQVGKESSFLFVIPPTGQRPEVMQLQVGEQIAPILGIQAGQLKSTDLQNILTGQDPVKSTIGLIQQLNSARGARRLQEARIETTPQLHALWQVLAPQELWPRLLRCSEIILIPDGVLNLLPFESLVVKMGKRQDEARYWLDEGPAIRYAPSATTLYNLEQTKLADSPITNTALLSLSDPIYDPTEVASMLNNPPIAKPGESDSTKDRGVSILVALDQSRGRDSYERAGGILDRLPGTAREAEALRKVFGEEMLVLHQLDANEPELRAGLPGKRYIHLATHGIIDQQQHSSLAALALTPPPGETDTADDDGFLQLYEIFDLKLPDCELAVLSACQTNIGRSFEGEGVFALSRGFLAAGARRVIASQWSVDDVSTAELVGEFFRRVAGDDKRGKTISYALALRDAKRIIRGKKKWAAPYYWAPFVLTGKR